MVEASVALKAIIGALQNYITNVANRISWNQKLFLETKTILTQKLLHDVLFPDRENQLFHIRTVGTGEARTLNYRVKGLSKFNGRQLSFHTHTELRMKKWNNREIIEISRI